MDLPMSLRERTKDRSAYLQGKVWLSVASTLLGAIATFSVARLHLPFFSRSDNTAYIIHLVDASTSKRISTGLVTIETTSGRYEELINDDGSAVFNIPNGAIGQTVRLRVEVDGFTPQDDVIVLTREGVTSLPITRIKKEQSQNPVLVPYTEVVSSGLVPSGSGGNFSGWYEVNAPPPKAGFVIDTSASSYYLVGDRHCNAWSECVWGDHSPDKLSFRFRLQGHSEYPPPGIAMSQGLLNVVYKPE